MSEINANTTIELTIKGQTFKLSLEEASEIIKVLQKATNKSANDNVSKLLKEYETIKDNKTYPKFPYYEYPPSKVISLTPHNPIPPYRPLDIWYSTCKD